MERTIGRREFLQTAAIVGSGACLTGCASARGSGEKSEHGEEDVSPSEDLMREHGVLKRVLLTYREALRRISVREDFPPEAVADGARIIREFIEDYHEKLEEDFLFPRFRRSQKHLGLVDVLLQQHQAGRRLPHARPALGAGL